MNARTIEALIRELARLPDAHDALNRVLATLSDAELVTLKPAIDAALAERCRQAAEHAVRATLDGRVPAWAAPVKVAPDAVPLAELARALRLSPTATRGQCDERIEALFVEPERLAAAAATVSAEARRRERDANARAEQAVNEVATLKRDAKLLHELVGEQRVELERLERERGRKR